jgi:hypothetical protein
VLGMLAQRLLGLLEPLGLPAAGLLDRAPFRVLVGFSRASYRAGLRRRGVRLGLPSASRSSGSGSSRMRPSLPGLRQGKPGTARS